MADVAPTHPTVGPTVGEAAEDRACCGKTAESTVTAAEPEEQTTDVPEFGGSCYHNSFCNH